MSAPRLEIDLEKIVHNTRTLVERLAIRGIGVTGVTKATLGSPVIAGALLRAGVRALGDSRVENLETMRRARVPASMTLIRSPMLSQVDRVVKVAEVSFNTELDVISALSAAARRAERVHGIVLMVELGDLREGILPGDLERIAQRTLAFPNLALVGLGTNLACQSGVVPDAGNMDELSALVASIESTIGHTLDLVSGGNSANLDWALGDAGAGRINDLRLGESILLGLQPLHRLPIDGLHTDAISLVAEVIESKVKPAHPWGDLAQTAFGATPTAPDPAEAAGAATRARTIVALGEQDADPSGLIPPRGVTIRGASSDHLVLDAGRPLAIGSEVAFRVDYAALLRAMTSPFVDKVIKVQSGRTPSPARH